MKKLTLAVSLAALTAGGGAYAHGMMGIEGDITRAQAQEKAAEMFDRMDANKDGLLNDADRDARMGQMFDALDADKNGAISREEFMAAHSGMHGHGDMKMGGDEHAGHEMKMDGMKGSMKPMGGGHGGMHGMHGMRDMMLKMADKNNDGAISATEFTEAHLAMFDKADANKDGTLTEAERKAAMEKMRAEMQAPQPAPAK